MRDQTTLAPYSGEILVRHDLQITDQLNGPAGSTDPNEPGTVPAYYQFAVPCSSGRCSLASTLNAIVPGSVEPGSRAVWEFGEVQAYDPGPDGQASSPGDNTLFARQGVFVP